MNALRWLLAMIMMAGLGWGIGERLDCHDLAASPGYQITATALLAIGLFGSTSAISLPEARKDLKVIVFAITVGVVVKAAFIATVMLITGHGRYAVLGLAVAQIDPLSVAAILGKSDISDRAKNILYAWSSFDDPVTTLLTVYAIGWLTQPGGDRGSSAGGLLSYAGGLWANVLLATTAYLTWLFLRYGKGQLQRRLPRQCSAAVRYCWEGLGIAALVTLATIAVDQVLMLGLAVTGLFFRPNLARALQWLIRCALLAAVFALGLLLTDGLSPATGALLAAAAWSAQIVAALLLPARLNRTDRMYLALGQQNGITAIILALALEPALPGTVAIVAPAILMINTVHLIANGVRDVALREPPASPPGDSGVAQAGEQG